MTGENADAAAVVGETWTRFLSVCNEWIRSHRPSEDWQTTLSMAERQSIHLGAFLHAPGSREMELWDYDATPRHSCSLASTGGDGEHFSVLLGAECRGVIVLTAPMAFDRPNVVVGETVADFLGLAVVSGFSTIPNISYRGFELGSADIVAGEPDPLVLAVRDELGVEPWTDVEVRLRELDTRYLELVQPKQR